MMKRNPLVSFLAIYCLLIFCSYLLSFLPTGSNVETVSSVDHFLFAISQASLTSTDVINNEFGNSTVFSVSSLLITQVSGIVLLAYLLWFYWQLFSVKRPAAGLIDAFRLTVKLSFLLVSGLFLFFLYAYPSDIEHISSGEKILAALSLAIGSFNNAGLAHFVDPSYGDALLGDSIIQIGIIAGITLGNLGIFVIDELLSPKNLRYRLEHPEKDWSMMTKLVVFGTAALIALFSVLYWLSENKGSLSDINIMESLIASFYEISASRGFGFSGEASAGLNSILLYVASLVATGPFSIGGGITLLSIVFVMGILTPGRIKQGDARIAFQLSKRLIVVTLASILLLIALGGLIGNWHSLSPLLVDVWMSFTCNKLIVPAESTWGEAIIIGLTNIIGRIAFIVACYLTLTRKPK